MKNEMMGMIAFLEKNGIFEADKEKNWTWQQQRMRNVVMVQGVLTKDFLGAPSGSAICFFLYKNFPTFRAKYMPREQAEAFTDYVERWSSFMGSDRMDPPPIDEKYEEMGDEIEGGVDQWYTSKFAKKLNFGMKQLTE